MFPPIPSSKPDANGVQSSSSSTANDGLVGNVASYTRKHILQVSTYQVKFVQWNRAMEHHHIPISLTSISKSNSCTIFRCASWCYSTRVNDWRTKKSNRKQTSPRKIWFGHFNHCQWARRDNGFWCERPKQRILNRTMNFMSTMVSFPNITGSRHIHVASHRWWF